MMSLDSSRGSRSTTGRHSEGRPLPPRVSTWALLAALRTLLRDPLEALLRLRRRYGDIYRFSLGSKEFVVLNHPDHVRHVLVDKVRSYPKGGPFIEVSTGLMGRGLATSQGERWRRSRRLIQPHFRREQVQLLSPQFIATIDSVLDGWSTRGPEPRVFDVTREADEIAMQIIVRTIFGAELSNRQISDLGEKMVYLLSFILRKTMLPPLPWGLSLPGERRFRAMVEAVDQTIYTLLQSARTGSTTGLMSRLVGAPTPGELEALSPRELRDEAVTLFVTGHETTSSTVAWAVQLLARHPAVLRAVCAEVDEVVGQRVPTPADLEALALTTNVVKETLRLYSPAWLLGRISASDDVIAGFEVVEGTNVLLLPYVVHHHPDLWRDPMSFDPSRFDPERAKDRHRYAWMPFGAGQRQCLGIDFAMIEVLFVLTRILQRFEIAAVRERPPARPRLTGTLSHRGGVWIVVTPRTPS